MKLTFIEPENFAVNPKKLKHTLPAASCVRKRFSLTWEVQRAELVLTALGVYEAELNGVRVGSRELAPGFTNYHRRLQYQTLDVTKLLRQGENELLVTIGNGWYRGCLGAYNHRFTYGTKLALAGRLTVLYRDGETETLETDETWEAAQDGPLDANDLKLMERYDARKTPTNWHPCSRSEYAGELVPDEGELLCEHERFSPTILHTPDGNTVLDFGQNLTGMVRFRVSGSAGTKVWLQMGETLDENGNFTLKNLQGGGALKSMLVNQKLEYTLREGEQEYRARFLISGFRYALLSDWPQAVNPNDFEAVAVYSDLNYQGEFTCSHEGINRFLRNVRWSMKSNFVDIPTDCPHRERAGWAGDVNVFCETANYLADTRRFLARWMADFVAAQEPDGALPYIIPEIPMIGIGDSSAGWSDAISAVPLMQYRFYGDDSEIRRAYGAAKDFLEYNRKRAKQQHWSHRFRTGREQEWILDTGFHYGEWLEPGGSNIKGALMANLKPDEEAATAWFYQSAKNVAEMSEILGNEADAREYSALAGEIAQAYRTAFLPDGVVKSRRQCRYVRPLAMGLVYGDEAKEIAASLNRLVQENHYRIGTGFLTTYQILNVLTDYGYAETAYRMLEQEECPGWLYEVRQGATTVWEGWDALAPDGKVKPLSQNHFSQGAAASWLFSRCAGIRPTGPGFRSVRIQPIPGGGLSWVKARCATRYGLIEVSWDLDGDGFRLGLTCPEEIDATVILPDGSEYRHAKSGTYACAPAAAETPVP